LAYLRLRDRDAIITREGIIFRVYGYSHPPKAFVCDPEYAPANIYKSTDSRAYRAKGKEVYHKFYTDEGLRFVQQNYPQHTVWHEPLGQKLVGVHQEHIEETRQPGRVLQCLLQKEPKDLLLQALRSLFGLILDRTDLSPIDFGVFGSLLHRFYHPNFSDLDIIIYGSDQLKRLTEALNTLYEEADSPLRNEFDRPESVKYKDWRFTNYSLKEYAWHQKRKQIYALFHDQGSSRIIKAEFEPVKRWEEIQNEYAQIKRITCQGWVKLLARVTDDSEAGFMPSIYQIEPTKVMKGAHVENLQRIISFVEEFRLQASRDEAVVVEGNMEQVTTPDRDFQQIALTYAPRYYEQALKVKL